MKLTDIWFTAINKATGESAGAKARILPGEDRDKEFKDLVDWLKKKVE